MQQQQEEQEEEEKRMGTEAAWRGLVPVATEAHFRYCGTKNHLFNPYIRPFFMLE